MRICGSAALHAVTRRWRRRLRTGYARPSVLALSLLARSLLALSLLAPWVALPASAIDFGKLVMPGPVIRGHADLENDCERCHRPFDAKAQAELCLDCHADVSRDRKAREGLHGRFVAARESLCRDCHSEHLGREADITGLDRESFSHARTDFTLEGAHLHVGCERCHSDGRVALVETSKPAPGGGARAGPGVFARTREKTFHDAPTECFACHRENDRHRGRLGQACARCHTAKSWGAARFDHAKTKFALEGAHSKAACALCHPGERYQKTPRACIACHRLDDVHRGSLGADCVRCHGTRKWKKARFDHDHKTKFPLRGRHRQLACKSCHGNTSDPKKVDRHCASCHLPDDVHDGRFGDSCDHCHGAERWKKATFDHRRDAHYALEGAHARVDCHRCHRRGGTRAARGGPAAKRRQARRCVDCHVEDDVHGGQEGKDCARCHGQRSWTQDVAFDHDVTHFPLLGLHALVSCEDCHDSRRFRKTSTHCVDCHRKNDVHEESLGQACDLCHNPNDWKVWRFDHDKQTHFELEDAHAGLECRACHRAPMRRKVRMASTCQACHATDDAHHGAFGSRCGVCHTQQSWKKRRAGR